jgi:hypothetical protein
MVDASAGERRAELRALEIKLAALVAATAWTPETLRKPADSLEQPDDRPVVPSEAHAGTGVHGTEARAGVADRPAPLSAPCPNFCPTCTVFDCAFHPSEGRV